MATAFLQVGVPEVWDSLIDVGGLVAVLLAIAVVVLWRKNESKDAALAAINTQIKEDAKEYIRVVSSMEHLIDQLINEHGASEKRVIDAVRSEARSLKEHLKNVKLHVKERADD